MAIKKTLLSIVQDILSDMDSEPINTLSDTLEGEQVAAIVEQTFNDIITTRLVPEHKELLKLTPLSDNTTPTHFHYQAGTNNIEKVWYDVSEDTNDDDTRQYREVRFCEPLDFIERYSDPNYAHAYKQTVTDLNGGTQLYILTNKMPEFYTSFDDYYIVMDSFNSVYDDTLQQSKVRAYGVKYPTFNRFSDTYVPDLDENYFPYLIQESKSRALELLKGGSLPKIEQVAKRAKNHLVNDRWRTKRDNSWNNFGR